MLAGTNISISKLITYIKNNQIAYQYCDSLPGFTMERDSDLTPLQIINDIEGQNVYVLNNEKERESEGYEDLCQWSMSTDVLFKVDCGLVICIPHKECLTAGILY